MRIFLIHGAAQLSPCSMTEFSLIERGLYFTLQDREQGIFSLIQRLFFESVQSA